MINLIVICVIAAVLYVCGILMLLGLGGVLLAGYNFRPKDGKAVKYHKQITRPTGIFLLCAAVCLTIYGVMAYLEYDVASYIFIGLFAASVAAMFIYMNTSKRIRRAVKMVRLTDEEIEQIEQSEKVL